jgi:Flp pilus assembly protein CpaB
MGERARRCAVTRTTSTTMSVCSCRRVFLKRECAEMYAITDGNSDIVVRAAKVPSRFRAESRWNQGRQGSEVMRRPVLKRAHVDDRAASRNGRDRLFLAPRETEAIGARSPLRSRRLLQPVPLAGFALMLVGLLVVLGYSAAAAQRTPILVAARNLPAGAVVRASDLRSSRLGGDGDVLAALVTVGQEQGVVGRRLAVPIGVDQPLPRSALAASSASPAAFTLAVPVAHAVGGQLQAGDRVSVLATFSNATGTATTEVLARNLVVLAVGQPPSIGDPNLSTIPVTVALPELRLASRLALANSTAKLDLLRDSNRSGGQSIPPAQSPAGAAP